jgi:toxin-antitoxin system, antitoxin component, xre family|nr:MAG TPA: Repressor protein CI [Caudoviricetes sp.]
MSENEYRKIFSKNLRYYMNKYNKKQSDLINDLGLSSSTISNWCTGEKLPRMDKVQILADYFHINKSDLIEEKEQQDDTPKIMQFYNKLNDLGKKEATKRVEELTYFPQYTDSQLLNAAHAYEGKSEEDKKHDDDIMDNDDEWT